ncbi:3-ketoacyl-ACP reductase [Streptococcus pneumoniae]|nr:3-ketoacyl-ACP reductase [Streptococcus pneumoniae]
MPWVWLLTSSVLSTTSKQCFELTSSVLSTISKQCFEQPAASFLVCSLIFIEYYSLFTRLT